MCGSYCTFDKVMPVAEQLSRVYDLVPILSENASSTDSRFGEAQHFRSLLEEYTGRPVITSIREAEPIGPKSLLDALVLAPCTGNTVAKLSCGITDSAVTMAAKAQLRNQKPVIIAVSTNDGLAANAENIGRLLCRKYIYFVPFFQDSPLKKPASLTADFSKIEETVEAALRGEQLQPLLCVK